MNHEGVFKNDWEMIGENHEAIPLTIDLLIFSGAHEAPVESSRPTVIQTARVKLNGSQNKISRHERDWGG